MCVCMCVYVCVCMCVYVCVCMCVYVCVCMCVYVCVCMCVYSGVNLVQMRVTLWLGVCVYVCAYMCVCMVFPSWCAQVLVYMYANIICSILMLSRVPLLSCAGTCVCTLYFHVDALRCLRIHMCIFVCLCIHVRICILSWCCCTLFCLDVCVYHRRRRSWIKLSQLPECRGPNHQNSFSMFYVCACLLSALLCRSNITNLDPKSW